MSVEPRSSAKIAAPSVADTIEPTSSPCSSVRSSSQCATSPVTDRREQRPEQREAQRRTEHRPDLRQARGKAALEQDQRKRDDPDRARELVVREGDEPQAVGAEEHPDAEEEHEARDPQAPGQQRRREAEREQSARGQDEPPLVSHRGILLQRPSQRRTARADRRAVAIASVDGYVRLRRGERKLICGRNPNCSTRARTSSDVRLRPPGVISAESHVPPAGPAFQW